MNDFVLGIVLLIMLLLALGVLGCLVDSQEKRKGDQALEAKRRARARRARYLAPPCPARDELDDTLEIVNRRGRNADGKL